MSIPKFMSICGFSLAVAAVSHQISNSICVEVIVFAITAIVMYFLMFIEKKIRDLPGGFFNKFFYYFSKSVAPYTVEYVETCYEYINKREMKYSKKLELKSKIDTLRKYEDKFCWSSYSGDIEIKPQYSEQQINSLASRNLWSVLK